MTNLRQAFTLLEVILSLLVMALVMAAVSPALVGAMRAERQAHAVLEPLAMQQVAFTLFTDDVQAAPQIAEVSSAQLLLESTNFKGRQGSTLTIFRDAAPAIDPHIAQRSPDAGQHQVVWSVRENITTGALEWVRQIDANVLSTSITPQTYSEVVLGNLAQLHLEALDSGSWSESFDSIQISYFPRALRVTYAFVMADGKPGPSHIIVVDLPQSAFAPAATL
jgi:prepilin-type N-terminal cleavage/methylation domain-containing protein